MSVPSVAGLVDDHTHSTAGSNDALASATAMAERAVVLGLRSLCLTEHLDFDTTLPEYGYYRYARVRAEVERAREAVGDRLEIRLGVEVEFDVRFLPAIARTLETLPVDFRLGAVHVSRGEHFIDLAARQAVMPAEELGARYREYFAAVRVMIASGLIDAVAHLDYPWKRGLRAADDAPLPGYVEELTQTMALAAEHGVGIELNTKRARDGVALTQMEEAIRRYVAHGGRIVTVGSDAHTLEQLGHGVECGQALLARCGLTQTVFRARRAESPAR